MSHSFDLPHEGAPPKLNPKGEVAGISFIKNYEICACKYLD